MYLDVLIACEFSGRVRDAFLARGHNAWSCDLMPSPEKHKRHIVADVSEILKRKWDLVIAHPPCTYLCNSGVSWLRKEPGRLMKLVFAIAFFKQCLAANADRICVENPIQHKYARERINCQYTQIIQPYQYGLAESKATCLWLKNLPKLQPTKVVPFKLDKNGHSPMFCKTWGMPKGQRQLVRSITPQGVADAMAEQWGGLGKL